MPAKNIRYLDGPRTRLCYGRRIFLDFRLLVLLDFRLLVLDLDERRRREYFLGLLVIIEKKIRY